MLRIVSLMPKRMPEVEDQVSRAEMDGSPGSVCNGLGHFPGNQRRQQRSLYYVALQASRSLE
jgi:hypothetical protein